MSRANRRGRRLRALETTRARWSVERMRLWIKWHRADTRVLRWIEKHEQPPTFYGTAMEYAYLEMPNPDSLWGRFLLWLGV